MASTATEGQNRKGQLVKEPLKNRVETSSKSDAEILAYPRRKPAIYVDFENSFIACERNPEKGLWSQSKWLIPPWTWKVCEPTVRISTRAQCAAGVAMLREPTPHGSHNRYSCNWFGVGWLWLSALGKGSSGAHVIAVH